MKNSQSLRWKNCLGIVCSVLLLMPLEVYGQGKNPSSKSVLEKAIAYHDPGGRLLGSRVKLFIRAARPDGPDRLTEVTFYRDHGKFEMRRQTDDGLLVSTMKDDKARFSLDGRKAIPERLVEKYRLNTGRLTFMRNYYRYLWFLPMILEDPGAIIGDAASRANFFGQDSWEIRVTYEQDVGKDVWYFYFHPDTYALVGYRFYHNEEDNDGEYILLSGETKVGDVRIPSARAWYTHGDNRYLGTDHLTELTIK